ncbi:hypothetical protein BCCH1_38180 [Burkholderia contaminans]|uniref:Uncharacterized protein n=1 Tax=Burkholderia contaminans TaxID=488447 RepID=A0A250L9T7_9BURK|nr:hypothetical protein BCCH1_38180 [Burkholderia contaminans]GLZ70938.1 hypothetical protein Bcon01_39830 [Burkholderia contaminans]
MVGVPKVTAERWRTKHAMRPARWADRCIIGAVAAGCRRAPPWRTIALQPLRKRGIPIRNELY